MEAELIGEHLSIHPTLLQALELSLGDVGEHASRVVSWVTREDDGGIPLQGLGLSETSSSQLCMMETPMSCGVFRYFFTSMCYELREMSGRVEILREFS